MRWRRISSGFTLIELMVVVAIIAIVTAMLVPSISNYFQISVNSTTRNIASIIKEAYNSSVITGDVHRLVYDFKEREFWVENGPANALLETAESLEKDKKRKKFQNEAEAKKEEENNHGFVLTKSITRKKISLPTGVDFEEVLTQRSKEPIREGKAYTHFFPSGFAEQTIIKLKDNSQHQVSLVVMPFIGNTEVYNRWVTSEEVFGK